jgi:hypothetical protein
MGRFYRWEEVSKKLPARSLMSQSQYRDLTETSANRGTIYGLIDNGGGAQLDSVELFPADIVGGRPRERSQQYIVVNRALVKNLEKRGAKIGKDLVGRMKKAGFIIYQGNIATDKKVIPREI